MAGCPLLTLLTYEHFDFSSVQYATLAQYYYEGLTDQYVLTYAIDRNDISSNSWGFDPCNKKGYPSSPLTR